MRSEKGGSGILNESNREIRARRSIAHFKPGHDSPPRKVYDSCDRCPQSQARQKIWIDPNAKNATYFPLQKMNVGGAWITYIVVVVLIYILFAWGGFHHALAIFIALFIGALVVFAMTMSARNLVMKEDERKYLNWLAGIAYILPVIALVVVAVTVDNYRPGRPCDAKAPAKTVEAEKSATFSI